MKTVMLFTLLLTMGSVRMAHGQSSHQLLRKGDKAYKQERYETAEENYRKALEKKPDAKGSFNLGNTVYNQDRYTEAVDYYQQSLNTTGQNERRAEAFYNLGNAQLKGGQLEEAIESYKEAVRLMPGDDDIRENLYYAKLLKKEQEQQQQEQEQQEQENQDQQEENSEQEQNQEQQQGENDEEQQQSSQSNIDNEGGSNPQPEETRELSREDAEKLLQVIENEEKNVQEKLRKLSGNKKKPKKDW